MIIGQLQFVLNPVQTEPGVEELGDDVDFRPVWQATNVWHAVGFGDLNSLKYAIKSLVHRCQRCISDCSTVLQMTPGVLQMLDKGQN